MESHFTYVNLSNLVVLNEKVQKNSSTSGGSARKLLKNTKAGKVLKICLS